MNFSTKFLAAFPMHNSLKCSDLVAQNMCVATKFSMMGKSYTAHRTGQTLNIRAKVALGSNV